MYEPLSPGTLFCDRYEVIRVIDSGGMGVVYDVCDRRTMRHRALKTIQASLAANPEIRARFDLEATATAGVRSDHLVEVLDSGLDPSSGMPYLVMELLEGDNLGSLLKRAGACAPERVLEYLQQVAWALDKMHEAGIVHRDLKPENLILTQRDDGAPKVKIIDFGIVKVVVQSSAAQTTRNVGTPCYMSPEQVRGDGKLDKQADLYALGHIAFALLTGRAYWELEPCYQKGPVPLLARILQGGHRERATERARTIGACLPSAFDAWFERATAHAPSERHRSATQLVEELARALGIERPGPFFRTEHKPGSGTRPRGRRWLWMIGGSIILLLTVGALVSHPRRVLSVEVNGSARQVPSNLATVAASVTTVSSPAVAASSLLRAPLENPQRVTRPETQRMSTSSGNHPAVGVKPRPRFDPTDER